MGLDYRRTITNSKPTTTQNKRRPPDNNDYKKDKRNFVNKANFENRNNIIEAKKSTKAENYSIQSKKSASAKPSCSWMKPEKNYKIHHDADRKKERQRKEKPISINSVSLSKQRQEELNGLIKKRNGNITNKKKRKKIFDPYDNPILNEMYKACFVLERIYK